MASYRISAIQPFDFAKPEEWSRWIRHFERFRLASDLASKSEEVQISTFIYSMGDKAEDILESFTITDDEAKEYKSVKAKFEEYFEKRRNTIYDRAKFNKRKQGDDETVDEFIADLYRLAQHCNYGALHDELVRDRIVSGVKDREVSEKLQREATLTLDAAVTMARQSEAVKKQQSVVRGESKPVALEAIQTSAGRSRHRHAQQKSRNVTAPGATAGPRPQKCSRCGKQPPHSRQVCPASEVTCHKCGKKGHYKRCCKTKAAIREITEDSEEEAFLGTVTCSANAIGASVPWIAKVQLNGNEVEFKVDTGADVTVIPESVYRAESDGGLQPASLPLNGPTGESLEVLGQFSGRLTRNGNNCCQDIYVVRNLRQPLLGKPAIEALKVVVFVEPVQKADMVKQFPDVFKGLGKLKDDYTIKLRDNATPYALTTPRRVPIPLLPKVKEELQRMEKLGVITKIEEPTDWCAGMVVVPKQNGKVRICVDLTKLTL